MRRKANRGASRPVRRSESALWKGSVLVGCVTLLLGQGCSGRLGEDSASAEESRQDGAAGASAGSAAVGSSRGGKKPGNEASGSSDEFGPAARFACKEPETPGTLEAGTMRRLTRDEWLQSVEAVVGSEIMQRDEVVDAAALIPAETPTQLVQSFAQQNRHGLEHVQGLLYTSTAVAAAVAADEAVRLRLWGRCAMEADRACAAAFLNSTATRLLKVPLSIVRVNSLLDAFDNVGGGRGGMQMLFARLMQSPEAVFHIERRRQTCDASARAVFPWNHSSVYFSTSADGKSEPRQVLRDVGWQVWEIPASEIQRDYARARVDVKVEAPDDTPLRFSIAFNDKTVIRGLELVRGAHYVTAAVDIQPDMDVKIGIKAENAGEGLSAELNELLLEPVADCTNVPVEGERPPVDDFTVATRLAYMLTGQGPDDQLLEAAARQRLRNEDDAMEQARRLIELPAARVQLQRLVDDWLDLRVLPSPNEQITTEEGISSTGLAEEARRELLDYITYQVFDADAGVKEMMSDTIGFPLTERMAKLYGTEVTEPGEPVDLPDGHGGLLLRIAPLLSGQYRTSPILRGVYVRRRLLCDVLPAPDFDIVAERSEKLEAADPAIMTNREIMTEITSPDTCMGCHRSINPLGFALEGFGPLGTPRALETAYNSEGEKVAEHPLDTFVKPADIETGGPESLADAQELNVALAESAKVQACFAERLFSFAQLREIQGADHCTLSSIEAQLREGGSIKEAWLRSVVNPELFLANAEVAE